MIERLNIFNYLTGFFLVSFVPSLLGPYRVFTFLVSIILIFHKLRRVRLARIDILLFLFWCLFGLKMFYSLIFFQNINYPYTKLRYVQYFLVSGFIPLLSFVLTDRRYHVIVRRYFLLGIVFFNFLSLFLGIEVSDGGDRIGRVGGNMNIQAGLTGTLAMTMIVLAMFGQVSNSRVVKVILFFVGLRNWFFSGTRSSLVGFSGVILNSSKKIRYRFLAVPLVIGVVFHYSNWFDGLVVIERFSFSSLSFMLNGRDILWKDAFDQSLENLFLGSAFVLDRGIGEGFYPHNLILESLMSLGLFGLITILTIIWCVFRSYRGSTERYYTDLFLIWLVFLGYAMISQSLYRMTFFWILTVVLLKSKKRSNENIDNYCCIKQ